VIARQPLRLLVMMDDADSQYRLLTTWMQAGSSTVFILLCRIDNQTYAGVREGFHAPANRKTKALSNTIMQINS